MPEGERAAPEFRVRVAGSDLPPAAAADIRVVSVHDDLDAPGMFTLELTNWDMDQLRMTWSDETLFACGKEVEIRMGYRDKLERLIVGEVTGLELEIRAHEVPTLLVRGYDRRHRLLRGRKTASYVRMKDSDIAGRIASAAGLTPQADDTGVTIDYVLQHNQTDLEFLHERARRIGYEVVVEEKKLYFRRPLNAQSEMLTIDRDEHLIEFHPRLTTLTQAAQVAVRAWSLKEKKQVLAKAGVGDEKTKMGGSVSGPQASDSAFGKTIVTSVNRPVFSQAEADQIAMNRFNEMAMAYVGGDGVCIGETKLRAGRVVKVTGLGRQFSGLYYVTSSTHTYLPQRGYRTAFTIRRNAT
jgi:phage protein D